MTTKLDRSDNVNDVKGIVGLEAKLTAMKQSANKMQTDRCSKSRACIVGLVSLVTGFQQSYACAGHAGI